MLVFNQMLTTTTNAIKKYIIKKSDMKCLHNHIILITELIAEVTLKI